MRFLFRSVTRFCNIIEWFLSSGIIFRLLPKQDCGRVLRGILKGGLLNFLAHTSQILVPVVISFRSVSEAGFLEENLKSTFTMVRCSSGATSAAGPQPG